MSVKLLDLVDKASHVSRASDVKKVVNRVKVRPNLFYAVVDNDKADELIKTVKEVATKEGRKGLERLGLRMAHNQGNPQQWYQLLYWWYSAFTHYVSGSGGQNDTLILTNNGTPVQNLGLTLGAYYTDPNGQYADAIFIFIDNSSSTYTANGAELYANIQSYYGGSLGSSWSPQFNLATASNLSISKTSNQTLLFVWVLTFQLASGVTCNNPQAFLLIFPLLFGFMGQYVVAEEQGGSSICMSYNGSTCFGNWSWIPVLYQGQPAFMFAGVFNNVNGISSICVYFNPIVLSGSGYNTFICAPSPISSAPYIQSIILLWVIEVS